MSRAILFAFGLCLTAYITSAKQFSECELVAELRKQGFPEDQMQDWLCLINKGSERRTNAIGTSPHEELIHLYGLFQIREYEWCSAAQGSCDVDCNDLITDDISKAAKCAKQVHAKLGFDDWHHWASKCKGRVHPTPKC